MDQSKWAVPRHRLVQQSKEAQNVLRPRLKVHGVWVHGVALTLFCVHPAVPADSSLVLECFLRSMETATELFQRHQKPMPKELICWVS